MVSYVTCAVLTVLTVLAAADSLAEILFRTMLGMKIAAKNKIKTKLVEEHQHLIIKFASIVDLKLMI